jgi:hypothetical protein
MVERNRIAFTQASVYRRIKEAGPFLLDDRRFSQPADGKSALLAVLVAVGVMPMERSGLAVRVRRAAPSDARPR